MKKMYQIFLPFLALISLFFSCSSAKNRAMFVNQIHSRAAKDYESANEEISSGNFEEAEKKLYSAYDLANSIDDVDLLCRIKITQYNLSLSVLDENSEKKASELILEAKTFASWASNAELNCIIALYEAKGALILKKDELTIQNHIKNLDEMRKKIKKSPFYLALLYRTLGDLHFNLKEYEAAAPLYEKAAAIHTKNRYLGEIGLDYYYASLSYSRAENKAGALRAIELSLKYDKDAENVSAIVSDYRAFSKILLKGNPTESEKEEAQKALKRAEDIESSFIRVTEN